MSDYKMNRPIICGEETLWYRTLRAIYKENRPLRKKEWLKAADISYSDCPPHIEKDTLGIHSRWSYRHWRGLYPAMFKHFQILKLTYYNPKDKNWYMNRNEYEKFCRKLRVKP